MRSRQGRGYLFWSGRGRPGAAQDGGLAVVIDGWIYNPDELPASARRGVPAFLALCPQRGLRGRACSVSTATSAWP